MRIISRLLLYFSLQPVSDFLFHLSAVFAWLLLLLSCYCVTNKISTDQNGLRGAYKEIAAIKMVYMLIQIWCLHDQATLK